MTLKCDFCGQIAGGDRILLAAQDGAPQTKNGKKPHICSDCAALFQRMLELNLTVYDGQPDPDLPEVS